MTGARSRRWEAFRRNRPALVSLWGLCLLFAASLCAELVCNDRPLLVRYEGQWRLPLAVQYTERDFGGDLPLPADYRDPWLAARIEERGFAVWAPVRFSFDTINRDREGTFPLPPGMGNPLGTDDQGRDVLARLLYGFRLSALFGLALAVLGSAAGVAAGALQGYLGGRADLFGQRLVEVWNGVPVLYLLIVVSASWRMTFWLLLGVMLLFGWMRLVPVVRRECLRARNLEYVAAARALGVGDMRILFRHVLPNALAPALALLPFQIGGAIAALASLDFLGFGLPPECPSLGELVAQGKNNLFAPWIGISVFALLACTLSMLVLVGEGVRDALDPSVLPDDEDVEEDAEEDEIGGADAAGAPGAEERP